jgi:hypothetical protein
LSSTPTWLLGIVERFDLSGMSPCGQIHGQLTVQWQVVKVTVEDYPKEEVLDKNARNGIVFEYID